MTWKVFAKDFFFYFSFCNCLKFCDGREFLRFSIKYSYAIWYRKQSEKKSEKVKKEFGAFLKLKTVEDICSKWRRLSVINEKALRKP